MPKNEDGEFELVLGNRQLLSVFFIVVILFGVFFTMGYIVGRNSGPLPAAAAPSGGTVAGEVPTPALRESPAPPSATPASSTGPVETSGGEQAPVQAKESQAVKTDPPAEERFGQTAAEVPRPAPATSAGGLYLQVAAVGRAEAEVEVAALRKRGFPALVGAGPSKELFRVLIGPYPDMTALARTKADLESLGFKPIVRKL
jgi:cell division septation protein DedD